MHLLWLPRNFRVILLVEEQLLEINRIIPQLLTSNIVAICKRLESSVCKVGDAKHSGQNNKLWFFLVC